MENSILEVKGLYKVISLKKFRVTEGVLFEIVPLDVISNISGIDRVVHLNAAVSPGKIDDVERPWYMHEFQEDNLLVLHGERHVNLYSVEHGKIESFVVTPDKIYRDGVLLIDEACMLVWPRNVFHRVSSPKGSSSVNLATRCIGYNNDSNFSIYDLNIDSGKYKVIREGVKDQF